MSRVVSCDLPAAECAPYPPGFERYFSATLKQQGDGVEGSVMLTSPGPGLLPYAFAVTGRVTPSGQLTFERVLVDGREPRFSGELTLSTSSELVGQMNEEAISNLGQPITLLWNIASARR